MIYMSNKITQEMNKIEIPKELSSRSKLGISQAKMEMNHARRRYSVKGIGIAVAFTLLIGGFILYQNEWIENNIINQSNTPVVMENGAVKIPAMQLPKDTSNLDMIGLIVYNDKIYTQTSTEIDAVSAKAILGKKLGTTKGNIDEWSKQDAYSKEFASTIEIADVYSVTGYDTDFRIMIYSEYEGEEYAYFYENLNGITINNGEDVFGQLNMAGNVVTAKWQSLSDWDDNIENYHSIEKVDIVNNFIQELNKAKPFLQTGDFDPIVEYRTNENFKILMIQLKDGSKVSLTLLKGGYIYYGYSDLYFKMDDEKYSEIWEQLR